MVKKKFEYKTWQSACKLAQDDFSWKQNLSKVKALMKLSLFLMIQLIF